MNKFFITFSLIVLTGLTVTAQKKDNFLWGVASAAYQVEGAYQADGKGESKWDFLANKVGVTQFTIGKKETGNVAINMYDRNQYLKDIQLMKKLGVNSYRFSLDWSRIIPDGIGAVNEKALAHYDLLIDDLKAAGIEPIVTLYHFDFPFALLQKGGWGNPEMINWYKNYASVVFKRYGKKVKKFITFNEPYIEFFLAEYLMNIDQSKEPMNVRYAKGITKVHNQLLANVTVIKLYHDMKLGGKIGITLNLSPCSPADKNNPNDVKATALQDQLLNTIMLDPVLKGTYPKQATDSLKKYNPNFNPTDKEMALLASQKPDFLGINFYAPGFVKADPNSPMGTNWMDTNPDAVKSNNGPVRPEALYQLLMRIKKEYNNPEMMITENGASFNNGEDEIVNGKVNDSYRADYIKRHIDAALKAKKEGVKLIGYMVWSGWDNFEWVFGYSVRFGLIHVNFETQERIPKQSFYEYQKIIQQNKKL
ncbi:glycosyl hydrolase family protein [Flavobacterium sufflavum]|uniref:Glycosyl hydrolase family protein n=1 Tax=Flavobacterium sufflavum TaxID=1921138 RepID=A0A3S2U0H1_9FLAO|nr:family 1 glycosylhydrolase [Flavobacterium sufflavum]RVT73898.1 glycosyl hydrolase family protein [Flavobacterium sufflavum]